MTHANKALGVYIAINENEDDKIKHLTALLQKFGHPLRTAKCEKSASMYTLQYSLMKTFEYPMTVTQLDERTWTDILRPTLTSALHKAGISMNFPRGLLFGPAHFQGYQLQHPYFTQEISHITPLLQKSVQNSQTGQLLRLTAGWFRLELGFPFELGTTLYKHFDSYVSDCWYKSLWKFCSRHPITICEDFPNATLLRKHDQLLMQAFVSAGFCGQELSWLNTIPMAIKAISSLADIVTADESAITHQIYLLKHSNGLCDSFDWLLPPPGDWPSAFVALWIRAFRACFVKPFGIPISKTLLQVAKLGS